MQYERNAYTIPFARLPPEVWFICSCEHAAALALGNKVPISDIACPSFDHVVRAGATRHSRNGRLWNVGPVAVSLRLDAGELDHLAPLLGFVDDKLAEVGRRSRQRRAAEVGETGLHL